MAVVLTFLCCACESWTVYWRRGRQLDMVPDPEVLTRAYTSSIHTLLSKAHVRWAGHVTLMPDDSLPKKLLHGELCYAKRSVDGQKKFFKTRLRRPSQASTSMALTGKPVLMIDLLWRSTIHTGARTAEKQDPGGSEKKRAARKATVYSATKTLAGPTYTCLECGRV